MKPIISAVAFLGMVSLSAVATSETPKTLKEVPAAERAAELAKLIANGRPAKETMQVLLEPLEGQLALPAGIKAALASKNVHAIKAFDNAWYIGYEFVGVWVIATDRGLILIDAMNRPVDVDAVLLPGMASLGLDPSTIRYLIITHGHGDHFGGAGVILSRYKPKLVMSHADWLLANSTAALKPELPALPKPDLDVKDADELVLGTTRIKLYITPGHTDATISPVIPVYDRGTRHLVTMWGGNKIPTSTAQILAYRASLLRYTELGMALGVEGMLSTHPLGDGTLEKARTLKSVKPGDPNPWLIGPDAVRQTMAAYVAATDAALAVAEAESQ